MKSFTILARPSCRPPSGFASALVLMTVATGFTKVEISGTGELRIEKTGGTYAEAPKHGARISPVRITLPDGEVVS